MNKRATKTDVADNTRTFFCVSISLSNGGLTNR